MMIKNIGIITQARMTSTRLPGKVLKKIKGKTLLEYHLERLKWAELPIIVATTTNETDDAVVELCRSKSNIQIFRGSENNVLSRYYLAAKENNLSVIIRVTSDCPLIDGNLIKKGLSEFKDCDYLSNGIVRTYPRGFDFEIFSFSALKQAYNNAIELPEKEHVTPYIYRTHRHLFCIKPFLADDDNSSFRVTVDTIDDFKLVKELIEKFECEKKSVNDIVLLLKKNPHLFQINFHVEQKIYGE